MFTALGSLFSASRPLEGFRFFAGMSAGSSTKRPSPGANPGNGVNFMRARKTPSPNSSKINVPKSPPLIRRKRKPHAMRVRVPEPGSLNGIMRQNPGISLFIRPIQWTDLHASLLRVSFVERPALPVEKAGPVKFSGAGLMDRVAKSVVEGALASLTMGPADFWDVQMVQNMLENLFGPVFRNEQRLPRMHMWFDGKRYFQAVNIRTMWYFPNDASDGPPASFASRPTNPAESFRVTPSPPSSPAPTLCDAPLGDVPMMAYVCRQQVAATRQSLFNCIRGPDDPVAHLSRLRGKILQPSDADKDSLLIGIFVSMAQNHFYSSESPAPSPSSACSAPTGRAMPEFRDLKLRVLVDDRGIGGKQFIVYTAVVTAAFLRQFHSPFEASRGLGEPALTIEYTKVPYGPAHEFRERLGRALGCEVVGSVERPVGCPPAPSRKRGREPGALPDVFAVNCFGEDTSHRRNSHRRARHE